MKSKIFLNIILIALVFFGICQPVKAVNLQNTFEGAGYVAYGAGYEEESLTTIVGTTIKVLLSMLGVVFMALMLYGGYVWMIAKGNEQEVTKAKQTITAAVIGLIIVMSAYAISYFVVSKLTNQVLESETTG